MSASGNCSNGQGTCSMHRCVCRPKSIEIIRVNRDRVAFRLPASGHDVLRVDGLQCGIQETMRGSMR
jgi:hypothetical protein